MRSRANATVGAPITVEGEIWGVITASWTGDDAPPADAEARLTQFAELVATAIANADSRDQLAASRARVVTAADRARRQVVRDLHDGAQQRLVAISMQLRMIRSDIRRDPEQAEELAASASEELAHSLTELRELARGIHPAVLTEGGLDPALRGLASRSGVAATIGAVPEGRFPMPVEAAAYFVVAEGLTNVARHADGASHAEVEVTEANGSLVVEVGDDGAGGATLDGSGLRGLSDRVAALGGDLKLTSPAGGGTRLTAVIPCG
jgi:signal transduction histidine kinase